MRWAVVAAAVFSAGLTAWRIAHPFNDGDIFWQRQLGEYILQHHTLPNVLGPDVFSVPDARWVPHEWLLGLIAAVAFRLHALWIFAALTGCAAFATLVLLARRAKNAGAADYATLIALMFTAYCMVAPFGIRAQTLTWPFLAALLLVLDFEGPAIFWAVPITIAWANLHAGVLVAVAIVWLDSAAYVANRAVRARSGRTTRRSKRAKVYETAPPPSMFADGAVRMRLMLCAVIPLAVLCTPLGVALPTYAVDFMNNPAKQFIAQWTPTPFLNIALGPGAVPLLVICIAGAARLFRSRPRDLVLTAFAAAMMFYAARNVELFAIVAAVPAAFTLTRVRAALATAAALVLLPLLVWLGIRSGGPYAWEPPERSVAALSAIPDDHRLLCAQFAWCSVALNRPNIRIFLDGRADPYPYRVWYAFEAISHRYRNWQAAVTDNGINAILAPRGPDALTEALAREPGWREIPTADPCCKLFIHS